METFMNDNFLLETETAKHLFMEYAKHMPICDYHSHLSPKEIWEDKKYTNITQLWLYGDHYKWRAMRLGGIPEDYITGNRSDYEKFIAYAKTLEKAIGNPLYHWTHLELQRYFDIHTPLCEKTSKEIWDACNKAIQSEDFSVRKLLEKRNVYYVATTDDPMDSLEFHRYLKEEGKCFTKVAPTFRPDKVLNIEQEDFRGYIEALSQISGIEIKSLKDLEGALLKRIDYFKDCGCRLSDHSLSRVPYRHTEECEAAFILEKALRGEPLISEEVEGYKTYLMIFLAKAYESHGWAMQLHLGAMRNNSQKMLKKIGPDTGFDSIRDGEIADKLSSLLNEMERQDGLPKTILYTLNPIYNMIVGTMIGNFSSDSVAGKMQFGTAWWFNDNKEGIITQLKDLGNTGLLGNFIGMLTDSRSFLSFTRHEYFRRILCNLIGKWMEQGEVPNDLEMMGKIVEDICFNNIKNYLNV
ncbi:MAG: glucuronate isomerase [Zhenhengia sp.]|uniref:glucuronate isomerase n=1 Tax=Zhenhengia sp. TaxID=2944208 RepID=UPI00399518DA